MNFNFGHILQIILFVPIVVGAILLFTRKATN